MVSVYYFGATPDGKISCTYCGTGFVEVQCPYCHRGESIEFDLEDKRFCYRRHLMATYTYSFYDNMNSSRTAGKVVHPLN